MELDGTSKKGVTQMRLRGVEEENMFIKQKGQGDDLDAFRAGTMICPRFAHRGRCYRNLQNF